MYYTYVLQSQKDGKFYIGFTKELKLRFERHNKGLVDSTKKEHLSIWSIMKPVLVEKMQQDVKNI